jgi:hypothetical protein
MRPKPPQVVRNALHAELAPLIVERVKSVLMLAVGTVGISIVVDLQTQAPGTAKILLTKLVGMCLYACGALSSCRCAARTGSGRSGSPCRSRAS